MPLKQLKLKRWLIAAFLSCLSDFSVYTQTNLSVGGLTDAYAGWMRYSGDSGRQYVVNSGGLTAWGSAFAIVFSSLFVQSKRHFST